MGQVFYKPRGRSAVMIDEEEYKKIFAEQNKPTKVKKKTVKKDGN